MDDTAPPTVDAPRFTAPVADGITERGLDEYRGEAPTVLAFFPVAFREPESLPFSLVADNDAAIRADYGIRTC